MPTEEKLQQYEDFHYDERTWKEGDLTVNRTTAWTAPGCHNGCGVLVYTNEDGKIVKVEGDPDDPYNQGRMCPRCLCVDEVMYHEDRILYPMKRDKSQRGNPDAWERITWDEAFDIVIKNFKEVAEKYGNDKIHVHRGTGRDIVWQAPRLAVSMGTPNFYPPLSGISCYLPRVAQMGMMAGGIMLPDYSAFMPDRFDDPRWEWPNVIMVWGSDPLVSNTDYQLGWWLVECMKHGTKVITVDPRATWFACRSDIHLNLRPGTDGALALAMAHVLFEEDLIDADFCDKWVYGVDQYREYLKDYTPEWAAEVCWLDADDIRAAARLFAEKKPSNVFWGLALDQQNSGVGAAMAVQSLWVLTGNVDIPGGMIFFNQPGGVDDQYLEGIANMPPEVQAKRCGVEEFPMFSYGITFGSPDAAIKQYEEGRGMKAVWIQTSNPLNGDCSEPEKWKRMYRDCEFIAAVDLFMTATIQYTADVVLPACCWPEKDSLRAQYYYLSSINKIVEPQGECKSDCEINRVIGRAFDESYWPAEDEIGILDDMLAPSGFTYRELQEHGPLYNKFEYRKYEKGLIRADGQPGFNTPTGLIEVYSTIFDACGVEPMGYFKEPSSGPVSTPELYEEYPIILMTGARSKVSFHTEHRQVDSLRQFVPDPQIDMNPEDVEEMGLYDGQWVWVENTVGRCRQRVNATGQIRKGTALGRHGWWYPEDKESPYYQMDDLNLSNLLEAKVSKLGYGSDIKCVLCKIYPVAEGEM